MGSPDLPVNGTDQRLEAPAEDLPMHGLDPADMVPQNNIPNAVQQPDDIETQNPYIADGYHPLNFGPMAFDEDDDDDDDEDDDDDDSDAESMPSVTNMDAESDASGVDVAADVVQEPPENTVERDILREVWNQPRPVELGINMDADKAAEIKAAMSSVSLNLAGIKPPDWATVVPESKWIEELLHKVRNPSAATRNDE